MSAECDPHFLYTEPENRALPGFFALFDKLNGDLYNNISSYLHT